MMKTLFLIAMVSVSLLSCTADDEQNIVLGDDYFPLEVGNYWHFERSGKDAVVEKVDINGVEWVKVENENDGVEYYREEGDKVYSRHSWAPSGEVLVFDFAANVNDTWFNGMEFVTVVDRNATLSVGKMRFENCIEFSFNNPDVMDDNGYTVWLAPGIGIVQKAYFDNIGSTFQEPQLKWASIDGQLIVLKSFAHK